MSGYEYKRQKDVIADINKRLKAEENHERFVDFSVSAVGDFGTSMNFHHGANSERGWVSQGYDGAVLSYLLIKALETHGINVGKALADEVDKIQSWEFGI